MNELILCFSKSKNNWKVAYKLGLKDQIEIKNIYSHDYYNCKFVVSQYKDQSAMNIGLGLIVVGLCKDYFML